MSLAVAYVQNLDPLGSPLLSTLIAALPVIVLFYLLVPRRVLASKAGFAGAVVAVLLAWLIYKMPLEMACMSFVHGAAFGLLPVGWTVFNAMLLYNITVETGQFRNVRRSISGLSQDGRIQSVLIGFCFGAFLEGSAGSGAPVAVCGAMLVGLGFPPLRAAIICLIANTSPVAYGGLGTPILVLNSVTDLPAGNLSVMAGHQLPFLSFIIPLYMVKMMCTWRQTWEVWPALVVGGGSFAVFQYLFATMHRYFPEFPGEIFTITDVGGGIFSMLVLAAFLKVWKPKNPWHFDQPPPAPQPSVTTATPTDDPHAAEAEALAGDIADIGHDAEGKPLTRGEIIKAWMPFALMSVCLMMTGFLRQMEAKGNVWLIPDVLKSRYLVDIPTLHNEVERAERLQKPGLPEPEKEKAQFNFVWLSAAGTPVFIAAVLSIFYLRMSGKEIKAVFWKTCVQMKVPIPTIACMLGLSYVTRYAGMDATLGIAFAATGVLYPFFAAILGWLGVFLTGTDAGSNALFGSLQKITATEVWNSHHDGVMRHLDLNQAQTLICTANSTGGVMGKMIDAQSICVATAGTNQIGKEADIFKAVVWHSIFLAAIVGTITLIQAFVYPFTKMVPQ
jgi:lactate permease